MRDYSINYTDDSIYNLDDKALNTMNLAILLDKSINDSDEIKNIIIYNLKTQRCCVQGAGFLTRDLQFCNKQIKLQIHN